MSKVGLLFLVMIGLTACFSTRVDEDKLPPTAVAHEQTSDIHPIPPTYEPLPPTPVLQPATEFTEGEANIPDDQYLFVEFWSHIAGSSTCKEQITIDFPTYQYDCDDRFCTSQWSAQVPSTDITTLTSWSLLRMWPLLDSTSVRGFAGDGTSLSGIGGGIGSSLNPITDFPYLTDSYTIYSVTSNGTIVAQVNGTTVYIEPGQSWLNFERTGPEQAQELLGIDPSQVATDCILTISRRLTNFGLLESNMIDVGLELGTD
jgi:hypothetical protein